MDLVGRVGNEHVKQRTPPLRKPHPEEFRKSSGKLAMG